MRDIGRIDNFLKVVGDCWKTVPDWRFGQLMVNFLGQLPRDPFFYEEDEMEKEMRKYFKPKKDKKYVFTACVRGNKNGRIEFESDGDIDVIVAGLITFLEKLIIENNMNKKALIEIWKENNMM